MTLCSGCRAPSAQDRGSPVILANGGRTVLPVTPRAERKRSIRTCALWLAVCMPVAAVIIYLLIWYGPDLIARHDIGNVTGPLRILRLQEARNAARGQLLTLGAGLFAAAALIFTALNFNLLRRNSEQADQWQRRTHELTEQGQVTDRYTKAIEQLGSEKLDVRIGGIYALERIARDSPRDHPTVMEVLAAFIREHSREQWPLAQAAADAPERATRPDVQAAVTVIGRRNRRHDLGYINLVRANLTGANLSFADLTKANLSEAVLSRAVLTGAKLAEAHLYLAMAFRASLDGADFTDAVLPGAKIRYTQFTAAHLKRADLTGADLTGADLTGSDLTEAKLSGADLTEAKLSDADLTSADLTDTKLSRANMTGANLTDADLTFADLTAAPLVRADLTRADLTAANLMSANLISADLTAANMTEANLADANLTDAKWPEGVAAPDGWQQDVVSRRLKRADTDSHGAATS